MRRLTYIKPAGLRRPLPDNHGMRTLIVIVASAALAASLAACNREGPAEKAGRQVDRAAQKAGDSLRDAGDKIRDAADGKK